MFEIIEEYPPRRRNCHHAVQEAFQRRLARSAGVYALDWLSKLHLLLPLQGLNGLVTMALPDDIVGKAI